METLKGIVTNLDRSTHTSGGGRESVITTHVATFQVSGRAVRLADREPLIINEGDEIVVGGKHSKGGLFKSSAYRNITRGVHGGFSGKPAIIFGSILLGIILCGCGLFTMMSLFIGDIAFVQLACISPVLLIFGIVGGIALYIGLQQRKTWQSVA